MGVLEGSQSIRSTRPVPINMIGQRPEADKWLTGGGYSGLNFPLVAARLDTEAFSYGDGRRLEVLNPGAPQDHRRCICSAKPGHD